VTENRLLRNQIKGRVRLSDGERKTLAEIGQKLGRKALEEVAKIVTPDTILAWHRKLVAQKFDGSPQRKALGRPTIAQELEALVGQTPPQHSGSSALLVNQGWTAPPAGVDPARGGGTMAASTGLPPWFSLATGPQLP